MMIDGDEFCHVLYPCRDQDVVEFCSDAVPEACEVPTSAITTFVDTVVVVAVAEKVTILAFNTQLQQDLCTEVKRQWVCLCLSAYKITNFKVEYKINVILQDFLKTRNLFLFINIKIVFHVKSIRNN